MSETGVAQMVQEEMQRRDTGTFRLYRSTGPRS